MQTMNSKEIVSLPAHKVVGAFDRLGYAYPPAFITHTYCLESMCEPTGLLRPLHNTKDTDRAR